MKKYRLQMHTHTAPCSKCAVMTPEELARALCDFGYAGAVLTNHFYGGNTGIDRALPWEEFVGAYEKDYYDCREAAKKYGVDILFGLEEHISGGREILIYGVSPKLIKDHPELCGGDVEVWCKVVHDAGGLVIQAHPFRERAYITDPGAYPLDVIDGIEVYNFGNTPEANNAARDFADAHPEIILTSGADTHSHSSVCYGGILTDERITDVKALVDVLKSGAYEVITP